MADVWRGPARRPRAPARFTTGRMVSSTCVCVPPVGGVRHEPCLAMATGSRDAKGTNMSVRCMSMAEHTQLCKSGMCIWTATAWLGTPRRKLLRWARL
eukprot:4710479-Alexandrium_andersonii.AAC.1